MSDCHWFGDEPGVGREDERKRDMTRTTVVSEVRKHQKYEHLIATAKRLPALATAVAHPCDETSLRGTLEAAEAGLIIPILVGPKDKIVRLGKISRTQRSKTSN